jgi:glycosyltransferase involved in cell wall biosynthesis
VDEGGLNIALIEPYNGGSHQAWVDGLIGHSGHHFTPFTLRATNWKWRMQAGAIRLAEQVNQCNQTFDLFVVSDMLNLSLFKSLLKQDYAGLPVLVYFHENQWVYPTSPNDRDEQRGADLHYGFMNLTTVHVAQEAWFNSSFNLNSMVSAVEKYAKRWPDSSAKKAVESLQAKSRVMPLGLRLNPSEIENQSGEKLRILWNHRWDHDKNPEQFLRLLQDLTGRVDFELMVLGEIKHPAEVEQQLAPWKDRVVHFGFESDINEYWRKMRSCDVLPVTSHHDFFGESIMQAAACGVIPILPRRLAYPEVFSIAQLFYDNHDELVQKVAGFDHGLASLAHICQQHVQQFQWEEVIGKYDRGISAFHQKFGRKKLL